MPLSKKSMEFLDNLQVYLLSSGKNEAETDELLLEVENHLYQAEKNGKCVEHITGSSPKVYLEQSSTDKAYDYLTYLKYIPIIILGAASFMFIGNALNGGIAYSVVKMIGYPLIFILFMLLTAFSFNSLSSRSLDKYKEWILFVSLGLVPILLFLGVTLLDRIMATPVVEFGSGGNIAAIVISIIMIVWLSIWSKTWISIVMLVLLLLPETLISRIDLNESKKILMTTGVVIVGVGIYFFTIFRADQEEDEDGRL
ncbi:HAAS domain-containing protein [Peribacillus sp. SCS-37]|uniref:HAAS domain-containing protein n=1 Tax=Paraperibacillus esterisolvens TaxID=3115296 RepID=UPI003905A22B